MRLARNRSPRARKTRIPLTEKRVKGIQSDPHDERAKVWIDQLYASEVRLSPASLIAINFAPLPPEPSTASPWPLEPHLIALPSTSSIVSEDVESVPISGHSLPDLCPELLHLPVSTTSVAEPAPASSSLPFGSESQKSGRRGPGTLLTVPKDGPRYPQRAPEFSRLVRSLKWYEGRVKELAIALPRLRILSPQRCRHPKSGQIALIDYYGLQGERASAMQTFTIAEIENWKNKLDDFARKFRLDRNSNVKRRVILVEDLSPSIISLLGASFQINPEFFADHLYKSGFGNSKDDDREFDEWEHLPSVKDHTSFEWYRPVLPRTSIKAKLRSGLLNSNSPREKCGIPGCSAIHSFATASNIWRRPWKLSPYPSTRDPKADNLPMGWNERMTVWTKQIENCVFFIILLDPLPYVDCIEDNDQSFTENTSKIKLVRTYGTEHETHHIKLSRKSNQTPPVILQPGKQPTSLDEFHDSVDGNSIPNTSYPSVRPQPTSNDHRRFAPFQQLIARGYSAVADDHLLTDEFDMHGIIDDIRKPKSTFDESHRLLSERHIDPLLFLFQAIHGDTDGLLNVIRNSIVTIRRGRQDQAVVQDNVWYWREILNQYEERIIKMSEGLQDLARFIFAGAERSKMDFNQLRQYIPEDCSILVEATLHRLDESSQAVAIAQDQLRVELQMIDSRRSIAEAESVSKITELAFIFVPITFVASLFSMQIKELGDGVPAFYFALVAIAFLTLAYTIRLMIRSEPLIEIKKECFKQARQKANLPDNTPVPTREFIRWAGPKLISTAMSLGFAIGRYAVRLSLTVISICVTIAILLSPIITLWHRKMNVGFSVVITLILLLLELIMVLPVWSVIGAFKSYKEFRESWEETRKILRNENKRRMRAVQDEERLVDEPSEQQRAFAVRRAHTIVDFPEGINGTGVVGEMQLLRRRA